MNFKDFIKNAEEQIKNCTKYSVESIEHICKEIGPRPCGDENEKKAQEYMMESLKEYSDSVDRETYDVHPDAFMSFVPVAGTLTIGASLCNIAGAFKNKKLPSIAAAGLTGAAITTMVGEFLLYKEIIDPFFKKKESGNVIAVRKATGETKRRIIISGHTDSAPEWTYTYKIGSHGPLIVGGIAVGGLLYTIATTAAILLTKNKKTAKSLAISQLALTPAYGLLYKFVDHKNYVPGAIDNLTGCYVAASVLKFLEENNIKFENTEVIAAMVGGEEAGLRGSKAFFKAHPEFDGSDGVETVFMSFDTLRDAEFMTIYNKDMTGTVDNDARACALMQNAAKKVGLDVPFGTVPMGATDAAAASQAGVPAASFVAMDPAPAQYYHTRLDDADILIPEVIEQSIDLALQCVFDFDENGLN